MNSVMLERHAEDQVSWLRNPILHWPRCHQLWIFMCPSLWTSCAFSLPWKVRCTTWYDPQVPSLCISFLAGDYFTSYSVRGSCLYFCSPVELLGTQISVLQTAWEKHRVPDNKQLTNQILWISVHNFLVPFNVRIPDDPRFHLMLSRVTILIDVFFHSFLIPRNLLELWSDRWQNLIPHDLNLLLRLYIGVLQIHPTQGCAP